jgi:hypothetical protein
LTINPTPERAVFNALTSDARIAALSATQTRGPGTDGAHRAMRNPTAPSD